VALNLAAVGSDWTLAASIMTFAIPVALFVVVATVLYFLYTRPHAVPGHRELVPATGSSGRHAAGAPRAAAAQPPPAAQPSAGQPQPPPAQPPGGGHPPGDGGAPGAGGYGRHDGMEGT
jgi:hypothetical protein